MQKRMYEFLDFSDGRMEGTTKADPDVSTMEFAETSQAKAYAGRMAKRTGGPVDLAFVGDEPWADRYITTAAPDSFNKSGYRTERIGD